MPARAVLIVMIVGDAALRTALAAQLGARGAGLLTASGFGALPWRFGEPAVLVVDEADAQGACEQWLEMLWSEQRWHRIVLLSADGPAVSDRDWLVRSGKDSTAEDIAQAIEELSEIENA